MGLGASVSVAEEDSARAGRWQRQGIRMFEAVTFPDNPYRGEPHYLLRAANTLSRTIEFIVRDSLLGRPPIPLESFMSYLRLRSSADDVEKSVMEG
jgi:hypothetical protein